MARENSSTGDVRLRAAVESAPCGLIMVDAEGLVVLVNREIEQLFGYGRDELLGRSLDLLVPEVAREEYERFRAEYLADPEARSTGAGRDLHGRRNDGVLVPVEVGLTPVSTEEGLFTLVSVMDSAGRRRADARFRAAVESSPAGMVMVDSRGEIVLVNREIERMFGWERDDLMGRTMEILVPERFRSVHPAHRSGFFSAPDARPMGAGRDLFGLRKDGTEIPVEIGLNPIETEEGLFVLASVVDISERKREERDREQLERHLRQGQKMDAVGTLAGGIAHDFNNILAAILGFGELLLDSVEGEARQDLDELLAFAERGKSLIQKVQAFGHRQAGERVRLSLDGPVREVESFLRSSLPPNIEITAAIRPGTPAVLADPSAMHQVLMNLGMNAGHAMPGGGRLMIAVEPLYITDSRARAHPSLREGNHVVLSVRDTGAGIDPEIQARVFEPFFTTKPLGKGTGLGLAIVHGIAREHEGAIELESAPGAGTTVRLIIPAADLAGHDETDAADAPAPTGKGQQILMVDDEPALGAVGKRRVEGLGYRVVLAGNAEEALAIFQADPDRFDAVISDYLMPGMTGLELASAIAGLRPQLPIILLTGFIDDLPDDTIRGAGVSHVLRKPSTLQEIAATLAEVLV
jgi:PAS domain S-box-containing protein